jgi:hypothetical protein
MNTHQLRTFLYHHKEFFHENNFFVGACDKLPKSFNLPAGFVINLSKSHEKGSHWVSLFIDKFGGGKYFDSFGLQPKNRDILRFIKKNCTSIEFNGIQLQQINSRACGKYAAVFLIYCFQKKMLYEFSKYFCKNTFINDILIEKLFNSMKK